LIVRTVIINDQNFKPKITKRKRNKKFTVKRRPYKSYNDAKWNWTDVFIEINQLIIDKNKNFFKITPIKYGIVYCTLKNKYYDFKNNKIIIDNKEHRWGCNKFFTFKQEFDILLYLKNNFIDKNEMLCEQMIKLYAIDVYIVIK
jgi:hypothetical protein